MSQKPRTRRARRTSPSSGSTAPAATTSTPTSPACCATRPAAEEVTAAAFERAYRKRNRFDPARGEPRAWLFGIARNAALDELRRRGRQAELTAEPADLDDARRRRGRRAQRAPPRRLGRAGAPRAARARADRAQVLRRPRQRRDRPGPRHQRVERRHQAAPRHDQAEGGLRWTRLGTSQLVADLRALRPTPRPEFAAELDERAAAGFPRRSRLPRLSLRLACGPVAAPAPADPGRWGRGARDRGGDGLGRFATNPRSGPSPGRRTPAARPAPAEQQRRCAEGSSR